MRAHAVHARDLRNQNTEPVWIWFRGSCTTTTFDTAPATVRVCSHGHATCCQSESTGGGERADLCRWWTWDSWVVGRRAHDPLCSLSLLRSSSAPSSCSQHIHVSTCKVASCVCSPFTRGTCATKTLNRFKDLATGPVRDGHACHGARDCSCV
jgi:hypothetical protein